MIIELSNEKFHLLTDSEKAVMNYINENEKIIPEMSIINIAEETYTSTATVSRAIRKCGFNGISELRYKVSSKREKNPESRAINAILQKSLNECTKTIENIRVNSIVKITNYIRKANKIYVLARGTTALNAQDFEMQLQLLGFNTYLFLKQSRKFVS